MKIFLFLILIQLTTHTSIADANPLIGKWSKVSDSEIMIVVFTKYSMTILSSVDKTNTTHKMIVQYKKFDTDWDIEMLSDKSEIKGVIRAKIISPDHIKFGVPGSEFYTYKRVK